MNILVVEDDLTAQQQLKQALKSEGHELIIVANVDEAYKVLDHTKNFDVIICNVIMPGLSGPLFMLNIKRLFQGKAPHVIVMSGVEEGEYFVKNLGLSYDHHLNKPIDFEKLNKMILTLNSLENEN